MGRGQGLAAASSRSALNPVRHALTLADPSAITSKVLRKAYGLSSAAIMTDRPLGNGLFAPCPRPWKQYQAGLPGRPIVSPPGRRSYKAPPGAQRLLPFPFHLSASPEIG